jgi:tetratricopeptide (TPR) repeat protein
MPTAYTFSMTSTTPSTCMAPVPAKVATMGSGHLRLIFALSLAAIASAACSKDEPTKEQLLSRADAAFAAEQYDKAEKEYRQVLRLAPEDPAALRQLSTIYLDQGQAAQAYPLIQKSAELQPDDPEIQLKLARLFLFSGEFTKARDAALQVLEKRPGDQQALRLFIDASQKPDDIEDARKLVQSLREKDQDRARYHMALGALDLRQNDPARAESEFKAALNLDPKSSEAYAALGSFYWSRNDLKEAGQAFKTAADLAPPRSPMRILYADFLIKSGANAEAKNILEDINRKAPDYLPPRVLLMKLACAEHQDDNCAARVQNILSQDPLNYDALFQDGLLNLAKGDATIAIREFEYLSNAYRNPLVRYELALSYLLYAKSASETLSRDAVERAERTLQDAINLEPRFDQATLLLAELKMRKGSPAAAVDLLSPVTKERPQIAQAQYLLGSAYLAQQKKDEALAVFSQMTELFPKDPQPSFLAGNILLEQGRQQAARQAFEKSAEISSDYLPATERLVDLDLAAKQYAAAIERVQKFIDKDPKLAQPWALRGKIFLAQRDFAHAEQDLLKAIELDPKLEPAYLMLAQLYVASNRAEEAIARLTAFVDKNKTVPALTQLAMINEQLKNFAAARDAYEKLLSIAPNFPLALNNLAVLYSERLGQLDKAYDLAKKANEAAPNEPHLADTLGWILFKKGDYGNALRLLQESASKLPDSPEFQFHAGMAHYMLGEEEPARIALHKAADASADFPGKDEARQRLALLAIDIRGGNPAVRTELENYLRKQPNDPAALARLAQLQQREGAVDQAVKTYEKVVADNPLYVPATRQLAILYGQLSTDSAKAYELVTKARQAYPDDPDIAKTLGILNYRRGNNPQAAELLKEAAAKRRDDPELLYYLGEVHHQLKQLDECKGVLERALTLNLSPGLADDARRALADCSEPAPG